MAVSDRLPSQLETPVHALVIGASGAIGAAFCRHLLASPRLERVIATARDTSTLPEHARLVPRALDVADEAAIEAFGQRTRAEHERLDLVLYCAGILHAGDRVWPEKRLADVRTEALEYAFAINAWAPLLLARELAGLLPRRAPCFWANLSARVGSIADDRRGGWYAYRASKAAQNMFTRTMAIELARRHRGLACVALHPGTVASALTAPYRSADAPGVKTPKEATASLLDVLQATSPEESGGFRAWDGEAIPW